MIGVGQDGEFLDDIVVFPLGREVGLAYYFCLGCRVFLLLVRDSAIRVVGKLLLNADESHIGCLA